MSEIPTAVKVGPLTYRILTDADAIEQTSDEQDLDHGEWAAFSDHDTLVIAVNPNHADDANRHSVLHEILHCCLRLSGAWPDQYARVLADTHGRQEVDVEEHTITALAGPMLGVLRDNPALVEWLREQAAS